MWTLGYWIHERLEGVLFQPVATVLFWIGKQMQRHLAFHSTLYNLLPASPTASMQNNHEVIFEWPHPEATTVIVTGTFDQWSSSIHLAKDGAGFKGSTQIPWDEKIAYKFIVDGEWSIAPSQPTETDSSGNVNNIYIAPSKPLPPTTTMSEKPVDKQEEAEAGGGGVSQVVSDLATAGTAAGLGYVASGVGAAVQTVVGEDPEKTTTKAASEPTPAPEPETPEPVPPVAESTPAVVVPPVVEAPPAPEPESTPPEPAPVPLAEPAPASPQVAPIVPIAIVPVNAPENNESPPPSAETKEEVSTHRPSSFSSTPVVAAEVPPAPTEVSPAPVEVPPAPVEVPPAPVEVPPAPTEAPPAPVEVSPAPAVAPISSDVIEDKKSIPETPSEKPPTNGPAADAAEADKPVPQPQLATPPPSAPSTPKKKEAFSSTESPSSSPASSSKFGTSGSARKKRSSIFGKINIKHMFSPSKDKDKDKK